MDYQLTFLIPALYGLGFSTCGSTGDGDSDTQCQDPQQTVSLVREPRGGPRAGSRDIPLFHAVKDFLAQTDAAPRRPGC